MVDTLATGRFGKAPSSGGLKFLIGTVSLGDTGTIRLTDPIRNIIYADASVWAGTPARAGSMTYNVRGSGSGKYLILNNIMHGLGTVTTRGGTSKVFPISFIVIGT